MIPLWLLREADQFWAEAGPAPEFPRDLTLPALRAFVVDRQVIPGLRLSAIEAWFSNRGCEIKFTEPDRRLRGCLTAIGGSSIIFIDGADDPGEHRFTFAHELAHFLVDYMRPRKKAIARLGPTIAEVLDGIRPPTEHERIDSALNDCPLGLHVHLLERRNPTAQITRVESEADQLAWELLAPDEVLEQRFGSGQLLQAELAEVLIRDFGFPTPEANRYAGRWLRAHRGPQSLIHLV